MVKAVMGKEKSAMKDRLKVLHVALERGNYELAAHALVYGLVKASIEMKNISGNGGNPGSCCHNRGKVKLRFRSVKEGRFLLPAFAGTSFAGMTKTKSRNDAPPLVIPAEAGIHPRIDIEDKKPKIIKGC